MTVAIGNTELFHTFEYWRDRSNDTAAAMSNKAVTVNSNSAVGNASVTGTFRANVVMTDTVYGGSVGALANLTISTNTSFSSNVSIAGSANIVGTLAIGGTVTAAGNVSAGRITVGNTVLNGANAYADSFAGTWNGAVVAANRGGTGTGTAPANGQILIGGTSGYTVGAIANGKGITITSGNGTLAIAATIAGIIPAGGPGITISQNTSSGVHTIINTGVTQLAFGQSNTDGGGVWRSIDSNVGDANNTSVAGLRVGPTDIALALGYIPANANANLWLPANTDTYYIGNVAIGFFVANTGNTAFSSNATFDVRSYTNNGTKFIIRAENANTVSNVAHSSIDINVANTGAKGILAFSRGTTNETGWSKGKIEYRHSNEQMGLYTNGLERITVDGFNIGIGTTVPMPNEGGQGLHISGTVPGLTIEGTSTSTFHMGINPAFNTLNGGARLSNAFGLYSDTSQSGIVFKNVNANTGGLEFYTGNAARVVVSANGNIGIGNTTPIHKMSVAGDVMAAGYLTLSDYRYKTNVEPMSRPIAVDRLMQLKPVWFDYIDGAEEQEGFLAHEFQEVIPSGVKGEKDGENPQSIDKTTAIPLLVSALQYALNRIAVLEKKGS
jgi:hypothetical protein